MTSYFQWIEQLSKEQFEFFKIAFDKGALALIVAMFGVVSAILLERYKSALAERQKAQERRVTDKREEILRTLVARTQLDLSCRCYGPEGNRL
jgi:hypothetical protein